MVGPSKSVDGAVVVTKPLDNLAETHSCIVALLESRVISPATRRKVEQLRRKLEHELTETCGSAPSPSNVPPKEIAAEC